MELVRHRPAPASVEGSVLESKWPQHGTCQPQERASSQWLHTISGNFTEEIERLEMSVCHTGVHIPFRTCVSPNICPGVGFQGHMVALFLVF